MEGGAKGRAKLGREKEKEEPGPRKGLDWGKGVKRKGFWEEESGRGPQDGGPHHVLFTIL